MKLAYWIAALVIAIATGFTFWSFSSSLTPYVDVRTALATDSTVQVRGKILHNAADAPRPFYDSGARALRFWIEDDKKQRLEVVYRGAKPDAFDTAPETAAQGHVRRWPNGAPYFDSDTLVVKCPSKYDDKKNPYKKGAERGATA